jgi:hypothetical protein
MLKNIVFARDVVDSLPAKTDIAFGVSAVETGDEAVAMEGEISGGAVTGRSAPFASPATAAIAAKQRTHTNPRNDFCLFR